MKKIFFAFLFFSILLNFIFVGLIVHERFFADTILVRATVTANSDIHANEKNLVIQEFATVKGDIDIDDGDVFIAKGAEIFGNVNVNNGNITTEDEVLIRGQVDIQHGTLTLGKKTDIEGDVRVIDGELIKDSQARISGTFPPIFKTSDYPDALAYFDILPEDHKKLVGYIFLTKHLNTDIRNDDIKEGSQYFDGIYYYEDGQLKDIDLSNKQKVQYFFDNAGKFFRDLPERRLGPFSVGATTKDFALNPDKADIYVPSEGSEYIFIHEMGHVLDYKYDFSDFHVPKYPFISDKVALNAYGATHPGEDFAEAYKYYALEPDYFKKLIDEEPERQQKYDYLKKSVFKNKEFLTIH